MDGFEYDDLEEKPLKGEKLLNVFAFPFEEDKCSQGYEVMDITSLIFFIMIDTWIVYKIKETIFMIPVVMFLRRITQILKSLGGRT